MIDSINNSNFPDSVLTYYELHRRFYKETKKTPRDFKKGYRGRFNFSKDRIEDHTSDLLVSMYWFKDWENEYRFYENGKRVYSTSYAGDMRFELE